MTFAVGNYRRTAAGFVVCLLVLAVAGRAVDVSRADSPGTLFQWNNGNGAEGGPPGYDEPLATDRPDFTEASTTVGRGVAQLEFGYTFVRDRNAEANSRTHSFGEPLLRVGVLADWLEVRFGWFPGEVTEHHVSGFSTTASGASDLLLGVKLGLTPQDGVLPEMALVPQMTVPVGSEELTAGEVLFGGNLLYGWDVTERFTTAGSTQFNRHLDGESGEPFVLFAQSWTVGCKLTDCVGTYGEWFALVPSGADTERTQHYFNGGFTFLVNNNLQLDARAGVGLSDASDDYFLGSGASIRF